MSPTLIFNETAASVFGAGGGAGAGGGGGGSAGAGGGGAASVYGEKQGVAYSLADHSNRPPATATATATEMADSTDGSISMVDIDGNDDDGGASPAVESARFYASLGSPGSQVILQKFQYNSAV